MIGKFAWPLVLFVGLAWFPGRAGAVSPSVLQDSFAEIAGRAKPAVVNITVLHEERGSVQVPHFFFGAPEDLFEPFFRGFPHPRRGRPLRWQTQGTGSGAIIDPRGYVVTNEHVVRGATKIQISLTGPDGKRKTYEGKVVGRDAGLDLAVVKIQEPGTYPFFKMGDSAKARVGDWAIAIGSPFELEQTVTVGVISALRQSLVIEGRRYFNLIQTDAAINRGNSGGPMLNLEGEIIGINTAIFSPSGASAGVGFAIAINEARPVIESLLEGKAVRRGWLGVDLAPVDEVIKNRFGLSGTEGALVNSVVEKSPAQHAGLKRGDAILRLDGQPVESPQGLARLISRTQPGKRVALEIQRQGRRITVQVALGERPESLESGARPPLLKEESSPEGAAFFQWEGVAFVQAAEGLLVHDMEPDSRLYGYLLEGDVVTGLNQAAVAKLDDLKRLAPTLRLSEGVVFDVLRQNQPLYISVQVR